MRIAILTYGTRGDLQPILPIADELRRRGHRIVLVVNENLAAWARLAGFDVVATAPDTEAFLKSPEGQRLQSRGQFLRFGRAMARNERAAAARLTAATIDACRDADLVLSTIITVFRGACIAQARGIPHAALLTFPAIRTRRWGSLLFGGADLGLGALNRASHELLLRLWWRDRRRMIAEMARALGGAARATRPVVEDTATIEMYSEHVAPRPDDWPDRHDLVGFPTLTPELRARLGEGALPPGLDEWLDAGPPPVFFGFGSLPVADPRAMLEGVIAVTRRRGLRALIGAGWSDLSGARTPPHVFVARTFDHDRVLPRCVAAVHHGGAGTTGTVLRAGLPGLIAAAWGDQPFWGRRLASLGVGAWTPLPGLTADRIDRALDHLLDPAVRARAAAIGARLRAEDAAPRAADAVERWFASPGRATMATCSAACACCS